MDAHIAPALLCIALAAAATAALIHQFVPSYPAFVFRRMFAWLAVKRAVASLLHVFDGDRRRLDRYRRAMIDMETAAEFRDGLEKRFAEDLGPEGPTAARGLATYAIIEEHAARKKANAARYLATMRDEDIVRVAGMYRRGPLEGKVGQDDIESFFRDERDIARTSPHMASGHFGRMEHRFNLLYDAALARA